MKKQAVEVRQNSMTKPDSREALKDLCGNNGFEGKENSLWSQRALNSDR